MVVEHPLEGGPGVRHNSQAEVFVVEALYLLPGIIEEVELLLVVHHVVGQRTAQVLRVALHLQVFKNQVVVDNKLIEFLFHGLNRMIVGEIPSGPAKSSMHLAAVRGCSPVVFEDGIEVRGNKPVTALGFHQGVSGVKEDALDCV